MENAAWRLALGAVRNKVRKLHWRTFCEPQKQNRPRTPRTYVHVTVARELETFCNGRARTQPPFRHGVFKKRKAKKGVEFARIFFLEIKSHLSVIFQPPLLQIYLYNKDCKRGGGSCLLFCFQMGVSRAFM